jgi:hypothetical protein
MSKVNFTSFAGRACLRALDVLPEKNPGFWVVLPRPLLRELAHDGLRLSVA